MVRPGVEIHTRSAPPTRGAPTNTGVAFFGGIAEKGPAGANPKPLHNMADFGLVYGSRTNGMLLYDACDAAFRLGVESIYVSRAVGPAAALDTHTFNDAGAAPALGVDSIGPGASNLKVAVLAGNAAGTFRIQVTNATTNVILETSGDLVTEQDAVGYGTNSDYIRVRALGANPPAIVAAVALAGGTDDRVNVADAQREAAINAFPKTLGPGQVAYPGATTTAMQAALLDHAQVAGRYALLDLQDTASAATLEAAADAIRAGTLAGLDETYGMAFAPWHVIPGVVSGTTRTVPPSAIAAGLIAASDGRNGGNPNVPAAGANGVSGITLSLSQPEWDDATRSTLNDKGVNVFRNVYGEYRLYGFRTLANPDNPDSWAWENAGASRLRMKVQAELDALGEEYLFSQIDGRGIKIGAFHGAIAGALMRYWTVGALYGDSADAAFTVDTGSTVNTPDTLAANELHAVVGLRVSPFAELVYLEVVKVDVNQSL